jgi:coenzyme PQQ synthesis protein D (PqqD)
MSFTTASRIVVSDEQVFTMLSGEAVILGLRDGVYYGLDAVGARVWELLAEPRRVAELVTTIVDEFDVTPERCERDLMPLLDDLATRGLVRELPVDG